ncbi:SDR family NAD(P)-dependent oxidoreductase [Burkholderia contaminans]|uniref:SDR family NAD(P)-dependent oxidoreductase n=2 Tax=Burkholderia contaminans TaxID=488447 RepID=A0A3N8PTW7_9BURK|nr:SDR family NAD(P)-dependent oxidoreductase [Burkholderia contaminans]
MSAVGRLGGKVAVVTGGSQGIGRATAELFIAEGAQVVIADIQVAEGEDLATRLGESCIFCRTDVTSEDQMRQLLKLASNHFGRIDCLFNNAGMLGQAGGIESMDAERFDRVMASHVRSVMLGMKHVAPYMKRQGAGSIVNTASIAGTSAVSAYMDYSAAKAAVIQLTRCVAMELGEAGIRVNTVSPGQIATGMGQTGEAAAKKATVLLEMNRQAQPIQRSGLAEDIAHAALFLASNESSFINGHDLVVDGGLIAGILWSERQRRSAEMRKALEEIDSLR